MAQIENAKPPDHPDSKNTQFAKFEQQMWFLFNKIAISQIGQFPIADFTEQKPHILLKIDKRGS